MGQKKNSDLMDQVKLMQKNIGDPSTLSMTQITETLNALNQTAMELKRACQGITDYASVLKDQQNQ